MLKERIQEVFDFTKSESPYRKANKGWINQDIFLDFSPSADQINQTNEDAKVTLFWSPINKLLSNIFIIIILGTLLVFTSSSLEKGRFDFNLFSNSSAKILEALSAIYDLDKSIADNSFGETQYNDFTESLKFNSELSKLVKALEKYYDSNYSEYESNQNKEDSPMSDELEDFLPDR